MKTLIVTCPECGNNIDLGEKAAKQYESAFAFDISMTCKKCGILFDSSDTNESNYQIQGGPQ